MAASLKNILVEGLKRHGLHCKIRITRPSELRSPVQPSFDVICKETETIDNRRNLLPEFVTNVDKVEPNENEEGNRFVVGVDSEMFISSVLDSLRRRDTIRKDVKGVEKQNIVVEYSSPNICKPFHVGHIRSTVLGNFVSNINAYVGHNVTRLNYLGDWGNQFGLLSVGYDKFGNQDELTNNPLVHLLQVYVRANQLAEVDANFLQQAKERVVILENRMDDNVLTQWKRFREYSVNEYKRMYQKMGIQFDEFHSESMYSKASFEIVNQLSQLNLISRAENGAKQFVLHECPEDLQRNELTLVKSDGSSTYTSRDVAAAIHRKQLYNFHKMYYVVGIEQSDHFVGLRCIIRGMQLQWDKDLNHVKFGLIEGMRSRHGSVVLLEEILNMAKEKALTQMKSTKTTKVTGDDMEIVASTLGLSGILINDMKHKRISQYKFDWNKVLNQKGDSGIFLQYAHARLCNLKKNCGIEFREDVKLNMKSINSDAGIAVVCHLARFHEVVHDSLELLEPYILVNYLFDLCHAINNAFLVLRIKGQEISEAQTRLLLFHCSENVLAQGMKILGLTPLAAL